MIFHVPVIFHVEAKSMEEAREIAYSVTEAMNDEGKTISLAMSDVEIVMADDSYTDRTNRRIVILHPDDVSADYSEEEYKDKLAKNMIGDVD